MFKKKTIRKKIAKTAIDRAAAFNQKAQWQAYQELQTRANDAWDQLRKDVKKNAKSNILIRDHNRLLLLLGECNYMAGECMRIAAKGKRKRA
ncbi:MAG: hypothetical protein WCF19_02825 [Chlamydiales bacterium]